MLVVNHRFRQAVAHRLQVEGLPLVDIVTDAGEKTMLRLNLELLIIRLRAPIR